MSDVVIRVEGLLYVGTTFPLEKLEALLDFQGPADLAAWLAANSNNPA